MTSRTTHPQADITTNSTEGGVAASGQPQVRFFFNGIKVNGGQLQKAHLSLIERWTKTNGEEINTHVVLYARNYRHFSPEVGQLFTVENNTELQSDYFEEDRIRIPLGHPLFSAALEAVIQGVKRDIRRCKKLGKLEQAAAYERRLDDMHGVAAGAARPWEWKPEAAVSKAALEAHDPASERWHVGDRAPVDGDITVLDENGLVVCSLPWGTDADGDAKQLASARLLAASPALLDALSLALTFITDPGATLGRAAVEKEINAALNVAVDG
jgi:hypothetical protein